MAGVLSLSYAKQKQDIMNWYFLVQNLIKNQNFFSFQEFWNLFSSAKQSNTESVEKIERVERHVQVRSYVLCILQLPKLNKN